MKITCSLSSIALVFSVIAFLTLPIPGQCGGLTFRDGEGKNEPLCQGLLKRSNEFYDDQPDTRCTAWDEVVSYPKFSELPWEELDPKEHKELLFKLMQDEGESYQAPFDQQNRDARLRKRVDDFIAQDGHLRVWRIKPALLYGTIGGKPITPAKEQTFVQKGLGPAQTTFCVGTLHSSWNGGIRIALPDLSGLDPDFSFRKPGVVSTDAFSVYTNGLVMYEGKPILVGQEYIWRFSSGSLERICNLRFIKKKEK